MALRLCIRMTDDAYVHFDFQSNSATLCGLETQGDDLLGIKAGHFTTRKVNCPHCIQIVTFCKEIKGWEYKRDSSERATTAQK